MLNCALGFIAGVIITNIAFFVALLLCRRWAQQDPESDYYKKAG